MRGPCAEHLVPNAPKVKLQLVILFSQQSCVNAVKHKMPRRNTRPNSGARLMRGPCAEHLVPDAPKVKLQPVILFSEQRCVNAVKHKMPRRNTRASILR